MKPALVDVTVAVKPGPLVPGSPLRATVDVEAKESLKNASVTFYLKGEVRTQVCEMAKEKVGHRRLLMCRATRDSRCLMGGGGSVGWGVQ